MTGRDDDITDPGLVLDEEVEAVLAQGAPAMGGGTLALEKEKLSAQREATRSDATLELLRLQTEAAEATIGRLTWTLRMSFVVVLFLVALLTGEALFLDGPGGVKLGTAPAAPAPHVATPDE